MEEIKETLSDVKKYAFERLNTPIFFYYLLTLAVWNWDILLLILKSDCKIEETIWLIKTDYTGWNRILWPLVIASGSSIIFPFIMLGVDLALSYINVKRIDANIKVAIANAEKDGKVDDAIAKKSDAYTLLEKKIKDIEKELETKSNQLELMRIIQENKDSEDLFVSNNEKYMADIYNYLQNPIDLTNIGKEYNTKRVKEILSNIINQGTSSGKFDMRIIDYLLNNKYIEKIGVESKYKLTGKGISLYYQI